jgi:hypothetical protein
MPAGRLIISDGYTCHALMQKATQNNRKIMNISATQKVVKQFDVPWVLYHPGSRTVWQVAGQAGKGIDAADLNAIFNCLCLFMTKKARLAIFSCPQFVGPEGKSG